MRGVLGIDPGLSGGLALITDDGIITEPMPLVANELDAWGLAEWLKVHKESIGRVYLEKVNAFPKGSRISAFTFGQTVGTIRGVLITLGIPFEVVPASVWCKELHRGITEVKAPKDKSRIAVSRIFPHVNLFGGPKCKKINEGMMDALLIAEYGRRLMLRGIV